MAGSKKDTKKNAEDQDKILLSDSDSALSEIDCDTCGASFSRAKDYQRHLQGKKHHKKVAEAKFMAKNSLASTKKDESGEEDDDDSKEIHCEVCDKYITGYISYASHLKGGVHKKNVKKQKLKQKLGGMPEVLDKEQNGSDSDSDDVLQKPFARCAVCQKEFSGPENFNLHLKSSAHKKKVKQTQTAETLKTKYGDGGQNSGDEEFFSKCDVCQKSFSGLVPFHIHMASAAHRKSLEKKKVAEEIKEFCSSADPESGYVCKECKKSFTSPLGFKAHLENNSHEKQKAKNALLEFLTAHPEIVFVTPVDKEDDGSDSDDSDSQYYLICKLCHFSFSGPESAQDHVKSKKHISIKKEKKMLKILKEQKKSSEVKTSEKVKTVPQNNNKSSAKEILANGKENGTKTSHPANMEDFEML